MKTRARRSLPLHGFTLVELLIAVIVVALALTGILAMLAGTTKLAGEVIEDTFAGTLARSVYESLRAGAQERSFVVEETSGATVFPVRGFVFAHAGVCEPSGAARFSPPRLPKDRKDTAALKLLRASDQVVFLPHGRNPNATGGAAGEPAFVFPRPNGATAENVGYYGMDDFLEKPALGNQGEPVYLDVKRVYGLRDRQDVDGPVVTGVGATTAEAEDQYGFAVVIRRSLAPPLTNLDSLGNPSFIDWKNPTPPRTEPFLPSGLRVVDGLYQVEVRVYRNFEPATDNRHHAPVAGGGFVGLIAIGHSDPLTR